MLGKFFKKPDGSQQERVPPGQYLTNGFPEMTYGRTPQMDTFVWRFNVWGLAREKVFTWEEFMALPKAEFTADFHCVTRWSKLDVQWKGIRVTDFLKQVELEPGTEQVMAHCYGGYTTNIPFEDFVREDNFFAYELFGEPLPLKHGGPMRLVVPHLYAWKSAKWINGLEFLPEEKLGFWELNGYHRRGEPWSEERYSDY
ncbi:sulfite oxidase-like oxidoreductase [Gloeobacter kilaueensis]|uniref:Oxidoreductase molybdopterin binding protein n=1 Tax=Gloeobacter kilaueensis (strain ATCC BAA-2537 / CCAP 1431/1 / ULC 316 / JS1) TaxID=1183438 RepID=U5QE52_GLOK1|nr:sulfite oxidase-like oxidoreductase [Gloeobacter kilaueensis]AGY57201.1 oxidoreductase molybdopterin binding protein [Gloeobacter kilaueensis JS1]